MHAARRILRILVAYLLAVIAFYASLSLLFAAVSALDAAPGRWTAAGVAPVLIATAPLAGIFLVATALAISIVPAAALIAVTEALSLRRWWIYAAPTALLPVTTYWSLSPGTLDGIGGAETVEIVLFALAGAIAGLAYWAIAGRSAGRWRRLPAPA